MTDIYEVRVQGHVEDHWSEWLGGLAVQRRADGTTVLVGPVVDQAALHGVISRIRDLGVPLLSVHTPSAAGDRPSGQVANRSIGGFAGSRPRACYGS